LFYRVIWVAGRQDWASLRTRSQAEAQERGEALLRALLEAGGPGEHPPLTLGELWNRYQQEALGYRENARSTQQGKQLQARALIAFFGASKRVEDPLPPALSRTEGHAEPAGAGISAPRSARPRSRDPRISR
jgi:hypothetical protein